VLAYFQISLCLVLVKIADNL